MRDPPAFTKRPDMTEADLQQLTLARAATMIARRELSPVELTQAIVARIERLNPEMRAFITVEGDRALAAAQAAEAEIAHGHTRPLQGIPVSVKDLYDTDGIKTTAGSRMLADRVPTQDATAVRKLREGGAVTVGKTNLHEFAFGLTTVNPHYGTAKNPWNKDCTTGGSSGGSAAAVALGLGMGSLGTDTGGSIRIPAALCGIVGLKPTYGRVSLHGVIPLSWSMDHAGPMARTVEDVAILLEAIAGYDPKDPATQHVPVPRYTDALTGEIKGLRIGIPETYFYERLAPEVDSAVRMALKSIEKAGARIVPANLPHITVHRGVWLNIASPEAYSYHENHLKSRADQYGRDVRGRLEAGRTLLAVDYVRAQRARSMMKEECKKIFDSVDAVITPAVPIAAPCIEDLHQPSGLATETNATSLARYTRFFNVIGLPAISIPCGFTSGGMPIGMQIAGKAFDECTLLRVAHAYEQDAGWFKRRPTM
jgi:aspartyl-tRNA(Asn)/glutamyl-tRNA(Gln) amidotransferase subunit A